MFFIMKSELHNINLINAILFPMDIDSNTMLSFIIVHYSL